MPYPKRIENKTVEGSLYVYRRGKNWKKLYLLYNSAVWANKKKQQISLEVESNKVRVSLTIIIDSPPLPTVLAPL